MTRPTGSSDYGSAKFKTWYLLVRHLNIELYPHKDFAFAQVLNITPRATNTALILGHMLSALVDRPWLCVGEPVGEPADASWFATGEAGSSIGDA